MSISHSNPGQNDIRGLYYDGSSSRAYNVSLGMKDDECVISGDGIYKTFFASNINVSEKLDRANRILRFKDGSSCEFPESASLSALFDSLKIKDTFANHLQRSWRWVIVCLVSLMVVFFSGYKWGVPYVADKLAFKLPDKALIAVSRQALSTADKQFLLPSKLTPERQAQLRARLATVVFPHIQKIPTKVEFRDGGKLGANAFALPDGTIVFMDQLVNLAGSDDEIVAVFAHEAGHVAYRHGIRQLIQSSIVAIALAAYFQDISSLSAAVSGFMLQAKYSRDFEREADRYAVNVLKANNLSPQLLGTFLNKLEAAHGKRSGNEPGDKTLDYISSHPSTEERMQEIKKQTDR
jgi:Zn-dependent protease with chaperone function